MKYIVSLGLLLGAFFVRGANPGFGDFNPNQFSTTGNKIAIKPNALLTNINANSITGAVALASNIVSGAILNPSDGHALTNLNGTNLVGTITNNTSGNAATATTTTSVTGLPPSAFMTPYTALETFEDYSPGVVPFGGLTNGLGFSGSAVFTNATIKSLTFSNAIVDQYLEITNGFYRRKLAVSNNWSQIRIIAQTSVSPNGVGSIGNCMFVAGICSSAGEGFEGVPDGSMTVSNFLGKMEVNTFNTPHQIDYTANSGFPYYEPSDNYGKMLALRTAGNASGATNVSTVFAGVGIGTGIPFGVAPLRRGAWVIEFRKTGASSRNDTTAQPEPAKLDYSQQRVLDTAIVGPFQTTTFNANAVDGGMVQSDLQSVTSINETNGALDSIDFYWNNPTNALQIYSIAVRAFY